jgi:8-oxo-dGTP diphosphatase
MLPSVIINVAAAIIRRGTRILITRRLDNVHLGGLWEFPGGKVEPGESLEFALQREISEELGVRVRVGDKFFTVEHDYPTKSVNLHFFNCIVVDGEPRPLEVADLRWVEPRDLNQFQFPAADSELIERLRTE